MFSDLTSGFFYVVVGILISLGSVSIVGVFASLQKKELGGDAISHALLPGLALAFLVTGRKVTLPLTIGCFIAGLVALFLIDYLSSHSKIEKSTTMGVVLSGFLGLGMLLLTHIQHGNYKEKAGLENFLLGDAASLMQDDIACFAVLGVLLLLVVVFLFKEWQLICFDVAYARAIGWPVRGLEFIFNGLTVLAIVLGIQTVGVVLMVAVLVTPVTVSRFWAGQMLSILVVSLIFCCVASMVGIWVSLQYNNIPTGPSIVLVMGTMGLFSFFMAPGKGLLAERWKRYRYGRKIWQENMLKLLYEVGEEKNKHESVFDLHELVAKRCMKRSRVRKYIKLLCDKGLAVKKKRDQWLLTVKGKERGARLYHKHIMWENYLRKYLHIQPDHVHEGAEAMEHVITSEMESSLLDALRDQDCDYS